LRSVVESMRAASDRAGVSIVTGDTKVVPRGKADQLFITTTGVGLVRRPGRLGVARIDAGEAVLQSGAIGDHGSTVMLARGDVDLEAETLRSEGIPHATPSRKASRTGWTRWLEHMPAACSTGLKRPRRAAASKTRSSCASQHGTSTR
jgi:hydrogenase maturation factor